MSPAFHSCTSSFVQTFMLYLFAGAEHGTEHCWKHTLASYPSNTTNMNSFEIFFRSNQDLIQQLGKISRQEVTLSPTWPTVPQFPSGILQTLNCHFWAVFDHSNNTGDVFSQLMGLRRGASSVAWVFWLLDGVLNLICGWNDVALHGVICQSQLKDTLTALNLSIWSTSPGYGRRHIWAIRSWAPIAIHLHNHHTPPFQSTHGIVSVLITSKIAYDWFIIFHCVSLCSSTACTCALRSEPASFTGFSQPHWHRNTDPIHSSKLPGIT